LRLLFIKFLSTFTLYKPRLTLTEFFMVRAYCLLAVCLLSFSLVAAAAEDRSLAARSKPVAGDRRIALIIGNSVYLDAPLKNPVNDADAMARVLRETGFDVTLIKNADRRRMFASIKEFGRKLKKSDVGLFYYAGHGVQVDSANYLLPVDLKGKDLQDSDDLRHNAFPLNELMDHMRDASTNNIIILDACRDNPFLAKLNRSASRGLAKITTPSSTSILYSTDPGNTASDGASGDNGVFTNRLVESIMKDGLELVDVMREVAVNVSRDTNGAQRPVFDGVLSSRFYFHAPEAGVRQTAPEPVASAITVDRQVMELRYWESTEKSGTPSAYQFYLKKFPSGDFADLARDRLEQMTAQKSRDNTRAERERLAGERGEIERKAKEAREQPLPAGQNPAPERAKPQAVASLHPDSTVGRETGRERTSSFAVSELTVTDEASGLTWVRDAGIAGKKNYANALGVAEKLNRRMFAGYDDWRMPRDTDCAMLHNTLKADAQKSGSSVLQVINRLFLNYPDWGSWIFGNLGSTSVLGSACDISDGGTRNVNKNDDYLVLLVRGAVK
jgi:hypothetical protein